MGAAAPVPSGSAKVGEEEEDRQEIREGFFRREIRVRVRVLLVKGRCGTKEEGERIRDLGAIGAWGLHCESEERGMIDFFST